MKSSSSRTLSDILTIVWRLRILVLLQRSHNLPLRFDVILYLRNFLTSNNENLRPIAGDKSKTLKFIQLTFLTFLFKTDVIVSARPTKQWRGRWAYFRNLLSTDIGFLSLTNHTVEVRWDRKSFGILFSILREGGNILFWISETSVRKMARSRVFSSIFTGLFTYTKSLLLTCSSDKLWAYLYYTGRTVNDVVFLHMPQVQHA